MNRHLLLWLSLLLLWPVLAFHVSSNLPDSDPSAMPSESLSEEKASIPLMVHQRDNHFFISWIGSSNPDVSHYKVERKMSDGSYKSIGGINALSGDGLFEFEDMYQPSPDANPCYRLKVFYKDGEIAFSHDQCLQTQRVSTPSVRSVDYHHFLIRLHTALDHATLTIYDMQGQLLQLSPWSGIEQEISLEDVPAGIYLFHISNGQEAHAGKIIVR